MKVYSDTLTIDDLAIAAASIPAVYLVDGAYVVNGRKRRIEGANLRATTALRPANWRELDPSARSRTPMGGQTSMPQHATYDEHGRWMARLFDIDPNARIKSAINDFQGREDFHRQTGRKYASAERATARTANGRDLERHEAARAAR